MAWRLVLEQSCLLLEEAGHKAIALDLPGHGRDDTPIAQVTFEAYCNKLREVVEAQPEPVILVGHSMGGRVVTQVAEITSGQDQDSGLPRRDSSEKW